MNKIVSTVFITNTDAYEFDRQVKKAIEDLQAGGVEVELQFSTYYVPHNGVTVYAMYIIGRQ